jgi:AcrR family transcriptional regulator
MSAKPPNVSARERILEAARRLFYEQGIRATGVDRIIAESGVAKMSFYRNFPSKKDLVLAFLERRHAFWMDWFTGRVRALGGGRPGLAVMADALGEWFAEPAFRGCAFINTVAETTDYAAEEAQVAQSHKEDLCAFVETLVPLEAQGEARRIARLAVLIIDGAIVRAQMTRDPAVAEEAKALLALLEADALKN